MKIAVLNGSPKGDNSISLQSILYLRKHFPSDEFTIINAGAQIRSMEQDFSTAFNALKWCDTVLFCYPVYTFLAPSQMHRFIELMKIHFPEGMKGKYAAQFTTSKHFYDITAHRFVMDNCADLGMTWLDGMSADMEDILTEKGRNELKGFWEHVHYLYNRHGGAKAKTLPDKEYDILIVTDSRDDTALDALIDRFRTSCPSKTRIINIADLQIKGGCLGCFSCAADGMCIYRDGYQEVLRNKILTASAIIYAFTIRDHSMGALFKMFDDRQFCNGHRMMTTGMPVGYLVNGDLGGEQNLRTVMEARAQVGKNTLCGIVSSTPSPGTVTADDLADSIVRALNVRYVQPQNFWGIGGTKIFRDLIYLMQGLMRADHRFYRRNGLYDDFPQKHKGTILKMKLVGWMMNNRKIRTEMGSRLNEGMLAPYRKVIRDC